jgi:predicted house-cleaning noncanonical NTP pyrophosphatase (MazG superfamily)
MIKLVRDKIPDRRWDEGKAAPRVVRDPRLTQIILFDKVQEELAEYRESGDPLELVDIYEVVLSLWRKHDRTEEELRSAAKIKRDDVGSFDKLIILELEDS